ncbi:MAG: tetratricopeptide repeat protein [Thermoanaerobaculia bacterium]
MLLGLLLGPVASSSHAALPELEPVPAPGPDVVEASVRDQLQEAHRAVTEAEARGVAPPDLARTFGELGRLYSAYELWDAARPCFANALSLLEAGPDGPAAAEPSGDAARWRHLLAYVLERRGDLEAAARHYRQAVDAGSGEDDGPEATAARLRRAEALLALGRTRKAEEAFSALAGGSGAAAGAAHFGLGRALLRQGRAEAAVPHLERALELQPEAGQVRHPLAQALRRAGRPEEARRHLERVSGTAELGRVRIPDPLVDALAGAARGGAFHKFQGDQAVLADRLEEATGHYRRAVESEPETYAYRKSLGLTLYRLGRSEAAARELGEALKLEPDLPAAQVPGERARLHYALGGIAANGGRAELALEHFREAARLDPGYADAHLQLGNLLGAAGRLEEALAAFDRAVEAAPENAEARLQRATTLMDLGRFADAIPDLERRLALEPGDERARWLLETARREAE